MSDAARGIAAVVAACVMWGGSMIFYKLIEHVPPLEVLAHRTLWTVVFLVLVLALRRRLHEIADLVRAPRLLLLIAFAAVMVGINWFCFVFSIQTGRALQSSLGYYIFPLVAVGLAFAVLGERFTRGQSAALALAAIAVALLTFGLGRAPWIALILAVTFALYGLAKNRIRTGALLSVLAETILLLPLALGWLVALHLGVVPTLDGRPGGLFGADLFTSAMLAFSGPLTGVPLMLFSYATRRVSFATVGLAMYLNPTFQFFIAVLLFGEAFTLWHGLAFPLIWLALGLYSWESWRRERARRAGGERRAIGA